MSIYLLEVLAVAAYTAYILTRIVIQFRAKPAIKK
jgi:hypothetical protein